MQVVCTVGTGTYRYSFLFLYRQDWFSEEKVTEEMYGTPVNVNNFFATKK
jgi:hypothetical protein